MGYSICAFGTKDAQRALVNEFIVSRKNMIHRFTFIQATTSAIIQAEYHITLIIDPMLLLLIHMNTCPDDKPCPLV